MRVSAKELTSLILDEERLKAERSDRKAWKSRVTGIEEFGPQSSEYSGGEASSRRKPERRAQRPDEDDIEYKLAIEASKHEAEEDAKRRQSRAQEPLEDEDLAKALKLSKEEEELRRRELEESNASSLFDDTPAPSTQPQFTGYNQGYQQQGAVDWYGNPVDPQQPQTTGYLNNAYSQGFQSQPTGFQSQLTGFQNQPTGFQNGFGQQPTGFDQFQNQQAGFIQPQSTLQPQQTAFVNGSNPYAQQPGFDQFQQQQQQATSPVAGTLNPWGSNPNQQVEALKPAPTGSNNPFASSFNRPQIQQQQSSPPSLNSLAQQRTATQFSPQPNPITNFSSPQPNPAPRKEEATPYQSRLNALLATGEGMDTFGNTGETRIPAQHTAPGNFINSAGHGLNKLHANQTGNNPFFSQQFTGAPQNPSAGGFGTQQQQSRFAPTQSGFGGSAFGQTNNNPFGAQQYQGQQQGGGSLIDL